MKKWFLILLMCPVLNFAQSLIHQKNDEFSEILTVEKVYLHTNSTLYQPGETIYFKAYLTDGEQRISTKSSVLYVEVINPAGSIVQTLTYIVNKGRASGSYDIPADSNGGLYKLKAYTNWQKNTDSDIYKKEITIQRFIAPRLLMKLEIEKEAYGEGDEVSAKITVRNLQDVAIKNLEFEYEADIDGQTIVKQNGVTDEDGSYQIRFNLPQKLSGADGSLNVKFEYESNTESISRTIPVILNSLDLQFMPEGGYSIIGVPHKIAFKALNKYGNPADVKGIIIDQNGNEITDFESFHQGLGSVEITMEAGKKYFAKITSPFVSEELIELPAAKDRTASLEILRINEDEIKAIIYSKKNQNLNFVIKSISTIHADYGFSFHQGRTEIVIPTKDLPMGILQFTLFDGEIPMAERLFFNKQDKGLKIKIETDKETYKTREKTEAKVLTTTADGKPVAANLSVSVLNDKTLSLLDDKQHNINSWLLAGSELTGEIYEPEFYFNPKEEKRHQALDLLLMTQGWRFYNWEKVFSDDTIKIQHPAENENIVEGIVYSYKNYFREMDKPLQTQLYLIHDGYLYMTKSDENGRFKFELPFPVDYADILIEVKSGQKASISFDKYKKEKTVEIPRKSFVIGDSDGIVKTDEDSDEKKLPEEKAITSNDKAVPDEDDWDDWENGTLELDVISLMGSVSDPSSANMYAMATITSQHNIPSVGSIDDVLSGKIAGLNSVGSPGGDNTVLIRGSASLSGGQRDALVIVDGVYMSASGWENMPASSVSSISVLKGPEAAVFGSRGVNGVIIITTKGNYSNAENLNINIGKKTDLDHVDYNGYKSYSSAKEFYMPKYESLITPNKDDFRQCIYWNYNLTTDEKGEAEFYFYNSDESTVFRIIAEGFDGLGAIGRSKKTYSTQDEIELETKFPLYATEGDEIQMPVWIKNNSVENLVANMSFDLPGALTLKDHKYDLFLKPDEIQSFHAPILVENNSEGKYKFRVNLLTNEFRQSVTKDLELFGRGFPFAVEQSSIEKAQINFNSKYIIPGSESAIFTIYLNPLEPILSGMERIIRQPHGCFEQLTSSVYPNIYALKLLDSAEKFEENQELEKRAKRYMNSGYRKMTSYEVKGGGFEWFGHQPASVYLTAFGLIQYAEMKDYLKVDEKMLNRTRDWLISRKDSIGGYEQERKYQKITKERYLITNAYTNYALSFAGVKDIDLQYRTAYNEVLESRDLYRTVLTALTAYQLGKTEDFNRLMDIMKSGVFGKGIEKVSAQGSITYSGRSSLRTEILALYAQALMKSNSLSVELNQVMKEIISSGSKGYFGSTQATGLALKSIYEYNKLYNQTASKDGNKVFLKINGTTVIDKTMTEYLEQGEKEKKNKYEINVLKYLAPGENEVVMEVASSQLSFIDFSYWYRSSLPDNSKDAKVSLKTSLSKNQMKVGDTGRMNIQVKNLSTEELPMTIAKIGIPGGLSVEPKLLKEMTENEKVSYYELEDNFLVLYWRYLDSNETKTVELVFKAEVPGVYTGVASSAYLYYTEEFKNWNEGLKVEIEP